MKIVADVNIPLVEKVFGSYGRVRCVPGREITNEMVKDASVLLVRSVTSVNEELLRDSAVKFVATATIGTDHVDQEYLRKNNIGFAYAPGCNAESVAQYVVAALLRQSRASGISLADTTLGIVGVGNVGSRMLRLAQLLGIKCLLNDPPKQRRTGAEVFRPLDEVLAAADVVTLHVPLTGEGPDATYHLVNNDFLTTMKDGAVLLNTSRGRVVDEKVLRAGRDRLGGLVLDVWESEPRISVETMKIADIATPHIAGYSYDGKVRGVQMIYEAFCAFHFEKPKEGLFDGLAKKKHKIGLEKAEDPVSEAVDHAYPIMDDDGRLRKISEQDPDKRGEFFDQLRAGYPERLEFEHYTVSGAKRGYETLAGLGFFVDKGEGS